VQLDWLHSGGIVFDATSRMRLFGTSGNPDFAAILIAVSLPSTLAAIQASRRQRYIWLSGFTTQIVAIVLCGSRTALVTAFVGIAVHTARSRIFERRWLWPAIVIATIAALLTAGALARNPRRTDVAARGRFFVWQVVLSGGAWHSFAGSGPGTFAYMYPSKLSEFFSRPQDEGLSQYVGYERTANNDFVQTLTETGWLGLVALCAPIAFFGAKLTRGVHLHALAGTAALLVAATADAPLQRGSTWALLWLWLGAALHSAPELVPVTKPRWLSLRVACAGTAAMLVGSLALRPVLASYWAGVATNLEDQGNYGEAVPIYRRSMSLDPTASSAAFNLPRALARSGDLAAAELASLESTHWINEPELLLLRLRILEKRRPRLETLLEAGKAIQLFPYSMELRSEFLKLNALH
jgi:hypothetical protein